jgi:hypothetical protein
MTSGESYLDSEILAGLRKFAELYPAIRQVVGTIAQFKVVLDANMAVAELNHKLKKPQLRQTALEEAVKASAVELHAPLWLDREMTSSTIPQFAAKRGIPEQELFAQ